ncbi:MAG: FHA domain-containing protein, partial [Acidimicrobiales bacterium]
TFKLDSDYVVGRQPDPAPFDGARPLVLSDPEGTVSPTHALVHLAEWEVLVSDQGSHFGTHVWVPGASEWTRLDGGKSVKLEPRSHLLLGRRRLVFEPVNRA